jgi:hypothetical protein
MPASILVLKERGDVVRKACTALRMPFDESVVDGRDDALRFSFRNADGTAVRRLLRLIPSDVLAYRAIGGGTPSTGQ